eukprot:TRINITY_DN5374_c0_g1_i2.p1 TRINITY_DN5374_c0_g1~~TRINITY_DN5374_c0_g1_i2.p1  ORF type:complete len:531 (+),score=99.81 TRINITY_DN5374_c0_g1_i2:24-1616(+)
MAEPEKVSFRDLILEDLSYGKDTESTYSEEGEVVSLRSSMSSSPKRRRYSSVRKLSRARRTKSSRFKKTRSSILSRQRSESDPGKFQWLLFKDGYAKVSYEMITGEEEMKERIVRIKKCPRKDGIRVEFGLEEFSSEENQDNLSINTSSLPNFESDEVIVSSGTIVGGTVYAFLADILEHNKVTLKEYFMVVHSQFIDSIELIDLLESMFNDAALLGDSMEMFQKRIMKFIENWIRKSLHEDFKVNENVKRMNMFLDDVAETSIGEEWREIIQNAWKDEIIASTYQITYASKNTPKVLIKNIDSGIITDITTIPAEETVRQITLFLHEKYKLITVSEVLNSNFQNQETSPMIHQFIEANEKISYWVIDYISSCEQNSTKKSILKYFIKVLEDLHKVNNFAAAMSIATALSAFSIEMIELHLPRNYISKHRRFEDIYSPYKNFGNLRKEVKNASPPMLYPPVVLFRDLTVIEESFETILDFEEGYVNYEKIALLGSSVVPFVISLRHQYQFTSIRFVQDYLVEKLCDKEYV